MGGLIDLCRLICLLVSPKGVTLFMYEMHVFCIAGKVNLLFLKSFILCLFYLLFSW